MEDAPPGETPSGTGQTRSPSSQESEGRADPLACALRYGVRYGILVGLIGTVQVAFNVVQFKQALDSFHGPDATNLVRGPSYTFVCSSLFGFLVTLVLYYLAAFRSARAARRVSVGVIASLLAAVIGCGIYLVANVVAAAIGCIRSTRSMRTVPECFNSS
jgi:hypothetical protein